MYAFIYIHINKPETQGYFNIELDRDWQISTQENLPVFQ